MTKTIKIHDLTPTITCSGSRTRACFNPTEFEVYAFSNIGSGIPMPVYHGQQLDLGKIPTDLANTSPYKIFIRENEETFRNIAEGFSLKWNGSNHVGVLTDSAEEALESLREGWSQIEPPTFWRAAEWFAPVQREAYQELQSMPLTAWVAKEIAFARSEGAYLQASDVEAEARHILEKFGSEE